MPARFPIGKTLIVSPHLDDAVFGCTALIALQPGTRVVTLFAGLPSSCAPCTEWDARSGFADGAQAMARRREEDAAALTELDAVPQWLDFLDAQYRASPAETVLADTLAAVIEREDPGMVGIPLGLFHSDHRLAHCAALRLLPRYAARRWLAYEDALYRRIPGLLQERLCALRRQGIEATPTVVDGTLHAARKARAVRCYASQLRALASSGRPGLDDLSVAEGYWTLRARRVTPA